MTVKYPFENYKIDFKSYNTNEWENYSKKIKGYKTISKQNGKY